MLDFNPKRLRYYSSMISSIMLNLTMTPIEFFNKARSWCMTNGYEKEVEWSRTVVPVDNRYAFFDEYVWVVINSGMRNKIAEKIYRNYKNSGIAAVRHKGKHNAILKTEKELDVFWEKYQNSEEKIDILQELSWIGPITKYHLARNIGFDFAKPDRWLCLLAEIFGYKTYIVTLHSDVQRFCQDIADKSNERIGTIDVILWRYCSEHPIEIADMQGGEKN